MENEKSDRRVLDLERQVDNLLELTEQMDAQLQLCRQTLEFYADQERMWEKLPEGNSPRWKPTTRCWADRGSTAKATLRRIFWQKDEIERAQMEAKAMHRLLVENGQHDGCCEESRAPLPRERATCVMCGNPAVRVFEDLVLDMYIDPRTGKDAVVPGVMMYRCQKCREGVIPHEEERYCDWMVSGYVRKEGR